MRYHIEYAKYKYGQVTVTGWLAGETAEAACEVWAEDSHGLRIAAVVEYTQREDVQKAFFPDQTGSRFGFRIRFALEEKQSFCLCLGEGVRIRRIRTSPARIRKDGQIPDSLRAALRQKLKKREREAGEESGSPYAAAFCSLSGRQAGDTVRPVKFSIVVPLYETDPEHLAEMLESVFDQTWENWELCLADGSVLPVCERCQDPKMSAILSGYLSDDRVRYRHLPENLGISGNSNAAFSMAEGDFTVMLDHDDVLAGDALACVAALLRRQPDLDFIYSDSDLTDPDYQYCYNPLYKPGWSPEMLYSANYITHLSVIRTGLLRKIGGWRSAYDGAQDWDLFLRAGEHTNRIERIPRILYHWRAAAGSTARNVEEKPYARRAQLQAVQDHLDRMGISGRAEFSDRESTCIRVRLSAKVSEEIRIFGAPGVRVSPEAADELRAWAALPGIGVVCPRILDREGRILSQGLLLLRDRAVPLFAGCCPGTANSLGHTDWYRDHVAAEGVCYAVSRRVWEAAGPPDRSLGALALVDFCLRAEAKGFRNLMTPFARVTGERSLSESFAPEAYRKLIKKYQAEVPE